MAALDVEIEEKLSLRPSCGVPPPPPNRADENLQDALRSLSGVSLLKVMLDEISRIAFKDKRRFGTKSDSEIVQIMVQEMNDILTREFLHVDFGSRHRDISKKDWDCLQSCRRSDSGTVGTIFLQCAEAGAPEIVVAKAIMLEDFEKTSVVNRIATQYFGIQCPAVRLIPRSDPEFAQLEGAVKRLFLPLNEELYNMGGHLSPKDLFSSHGVLLLEFVQGKPLCHRTQGQRALGVEDYAALGKLFLLDLLIRNTDRLPCSRAMPRPGSKLISDHGNAGNIMFGAAPGEVWSIDPEMQIAVDQAIEEAYGSAVDSVVNEIMQQEAAQPCFQALDALFFCNIPGLKGILDLSLHDMRHWAQLPPLEAAALSSVLDMIRLRAQVDSSRICGRTNGQLPPSNNDERCWRDWIRLAAPRAVADVLQFLELYTGYSTLQHAEQAFAAGFAESLQAALAFKMEYEAAGEEKAKNAASDSIDIGFIMRMINRVAKHADSSR